MNHSPARIVLVTGGSRGIGADVAQRLNDDGTHVIVGGDMTDEAQCAALLDDIAARFGRVDAVVLNASGGLDTRVDRNTLRRLARKALPLMPAGGRVVFATSHQAHFFPHKAVPKGYTAVAAGTRAAETTLHSMRAEFHEAGVQLTVVSGEIADATLAGAVVTATTTPTPSSIVFVGDADYLMTAA